MVATASTEHSYWLALAFVAWKCFTQRLRLNGNRALVWTCLMKILLSYVIVALPSCFKHSVHYYRSGQPRHVARKEHQHQHRGSCPQNCLLYPQQICLTNLCWLHLKLMYPQNVASGVQTKTLVDYAHGRRSAKKVGRPIRGQNESPFLPFFPFLSLPCTPSQALRSRPS